MDAAGEEGARVCEGFGGGGRRRERARRAEHFGRSAENGGWSESERGFKHSRLVVELCWGWGAVRVRKELSA